jgi:RNA polymerase sigma-54 factor
MGYDIRQTITIAMRQEQRLVMTQQMQQAIAMLQLAHHELLEQVTDELVENPILEQEETEKSNESVNEEGNQKDSGEYETAQSTVAEVPSADNITVKEENKLREDVEWSSYVADSFNRPKGSGGEVLSTGEDYTPIESRTASKPGLAEHLNWQLGVSGCSPEEKIAGTFIIGNLDRFGYLNDITLDEISIQLNIPIEIVDAALARIQEFDPIGVGARSLSECLLIQADYYGEIDDVIEKILLEHIHDLERKDYTKISKSVGVPLDEVYEIIKTILTFDPKPGRAYSKEEITYITPDVFVYKQGDEYQVVLNDDGLPKLRLSKYYVNAMQGKSDEKTKDYVEGKMRKAKWLIQAIRMRQDTITKVTKSIVKFQREFLEKGAVYMKPLTLKVVADDIGRHESTVSRVTTNKYVQTPQGLFELKFFFSSSVRRIDGLDIASLSVKEKIKRLIEDEDSKKPLSDQKLADLLYKQGINVARRTVAKYREQLKILSSSRRRSPF